MLLQSQKYFYFPYVAEVGLRLDLLDLGPNPREVRERFWAKMAELAYLLRFIQPEISEPPEPSPVPLSAQEILEAHQLAQKIAPPAGLEEEMKGSENPQSPVPLTLEDLIEGEFR